MNINEIIYHKIAGLITADEEKVLEQWLNDSPSHRQKYEQLLNAPDFSTYYFIYRHLDVERAWENLIGNESLDDNEETDKIHKESRFTLLRVLKYAAAVLFLIVAGVGYWYSQYTKVTPPEISESVQIAMRQSAQSGKTDAVIEEVLDLSAKNSVGRNENQEKKDDRRVLNEAGRDESSAPSLSPFTFSKEQLLAARRITTHHDKEFWLTLDDGTLVHLNYNTHLIYPEKFGRSDRNVVLDGEAYFMVARDKSRPFIVHTPNGDVKVYGTEFNVNTNHFTSVVLVKGSVSVTPVGGKEIMLKPGQQCELSSEKLQLTTVDVEPYIAWNTGDFIFHDWTLRQIMSVLAKWYNVTVEFSSDDIAKQKFYGSFSRYDNIQSTMETIEAVTGYTIKLNNNKIIIKK